MPRGKTKQSDTNDEKEIKSETENVIKPIKKEEISGKIDLNKFKFEKKPKIKIEFDNDENTQKVVIFYFFK